MGVNKEVKARLKSKLITIDSTTNKEGEESMGPGKLEGGTESTNFKRVNRIFWIRARMFART